MSLGTDSNNSELDPSKEGYRQALLSLMEYYSEEYWCAGWAWSLDFMLHLCAEGRWDRLATNHAQALRALVPLAGGWWVWSDEKKGKEFVSLDDWLPKFRAWEEGCKNDEWWEQVRPPKAGVADSNDSIADDDLPRDVRFQSAYARAREIVEGVFKPLTMELAKELVGRDLPGMLHTWRRLYHHALSIKDDETAAFLAACIEDLEFLHGRTYREPAPLSDPSGPTRSIPKRIWVFQGDRGRGIGAVFGDLDGARSWIQRHRLDGSLSEYPMNTGLYDWALDQGNHQAPADGDTASFIANFQDLGRKTLWFAHGAEYTPHPSAGLDVHIKEVP